MVLALGGWVAIAFIQPLDSGPMIWLAGLLTLCGASAAAFWSWRERQRLQDGVDS